MNSSSAQAGKMVRTSQFLALTPCARFATIGRRIVPLALELVKPSSVVDFGCGIGMWLAAFRDEGIEDVLGIDGSYVDRRQLRVPSDAFIASDLTQPVSLSRTFDLAVSV